MRKNRTLFVERHLLVKVLAGSRMYGTSRIDSDYDYRGVCVPPIESMIGLDRFEQIEMAEHDTVIYTTTRFFHLALDNNPNILDILFAPPSTWVTDSHDWHKVYEMRHRFLCRDALRRFGGYALSQLKRIKSHKAWLMNPIELEPQPEDYDCYLEVDDKGGQMWDGVRIDEFKGARRAWKQYQEWKVNRNPQRAVLEAAYGYDVKHASQLVRLLIKALSIKNTGDYTPILDKAELGEVKRVLNGEWEYDFLINWAEDAHQVLDSGAATNLRPRPDWNAAEKLLMEINERGLRRQWPPSG